VEEEITGRQCTLEGYAFQNEVTIYGIVDSIRDSNRTSFARYEYPSRLPKRVQQRMIDAAEKFIQHIGFNNAAFNIEFFYNPQHDRVSLLEINPRTSQSHSDLFEKVDGTSNFEIMVDLALGNQPDFTPGQGAYRCAAKFFIRRYEDALVREVPDAEKVQAVQQQIPDTLIQINVKPGMRLSDLLNQDSYSYEIADVFIGAENSKELLQKYRACVKMLPFRFDHE
jgi:carbamoylphosphate synthase large subunit